MNEDILQNINHRIDKALEYSRRLVEDEHLEERIEELKYEASRYIHKNPLKSVAAGLFVGYMIGKLFSSEDD